MKLLVILSTFWESHCGMISSLSLSVNCFLDDGLPPQVLMYIYISFQDEETSEDLIICIPTLLKLNKFSPWIFYLHLEVFSTLYLVSLFFGRMFLDYFCLFLLGYYY